MFPMWIGPQNTYDFETDNHLDIFSVHTQMYCNFKLFFFQIAFIYWENQNLGQNLIYQLFLIYFFKTVEL